MRKLLLIILLPVVLLGQYAITGPGGLVIQLDTLDGFFGIGDTVGEGRRLMFDYNYPWMRSNSPFAVMIDSVVYNNTNWLSAMCSHNHLRPFRGPISTSTDGFTTQWNIPIDSTGEIIFTQKLRAVMIDDLPACEITYMAFNNHSIDHRIAFRQAIDVLVGTNDYAPMALGPSYSSIGDIIYFPEIPYFWMAFEESPGFAGEQVVARGLLRGLSVNPEVFAYGEYFYLNDDCWVPDTRVIDDSYHDSGISLLWEEQQVSPEKTYQVTTIYGFGAAPEPGSEAMVMSLVPNSVGSACDSWAQNPFEAALMVYNISIADGIDSLRACIHLDAGLSIIADAVHESDTCVLLAPRLRLDSTAIASWLVEADDAYFTFGPTEASVITSVTSITPEFLDRVETTYVHIPDPMGIPPTLDDILVPSNAISGVTVPLFQTKYLLQDESGIDYSSLIVQIGSLFHYHGDDNVNFYGDTLALTIPSYWLIHGNYIQHGVVAVSDSDGCSPDSIPHVSGFWVDQRAPSVGASYPPHGSVMSDSLTPISLWLYDWPAGIYMPSITAFIEVDGMREYLDYFDSELTYSAEDTALIYTPAEPWPDGSVIAFCLTGVADNCHTGSIFTPRNANSDTHCIAFTVEYASIGETGIPLKFSLNAYPNPFNAAVTIDAPLAQNLEIFDIQGRKVADLSHKLDGIRNSGIVWDGTSDSKQLPTGVYYVRASASDSEIIRRIVLIR